MVRGERRGGVVRGREGWCGEGEGGVVRLR